MLHISSSEVLVWFISSSFLVSRWYHITNHQMWFGIYKNLNNIGYGYYRVLKIINYDGISFITVVLKKFNQGYSSLFE